MITMIEPTDPVERAIAIKICRANAGLHPETGERDESASNAYWHANWEQLPYEKWIWIWNNAPFEWDTKHLIHFPVVGISHDAS